MTLQERGEPLQSPWVSRFDDYLQRAITVTVNFDNATRVIIDGTVVRDAGCLWSKLLFGVGPDGTPDSTPTKVNVPFGLTTIPKSAFTAFNFNTIEQVQALQITAGQ